MKYADGGHNGFHFGKLPNGDGYRLERRFTTEDGTSYREIAGGLEGDGEWSATQFEPLLQWCIDEFFSHCEAHGGFISRK